MKSIVQSDRFNKEFQKFMKYYKSWLLTIEMAERDDPLAKYKQPKPDPSTSMDDENEFDQQSSVDREKGY